VDAKDTDPLQKFISNNGGKAFTALQNAMGNDSQKITALAESLSSTNELTRMHAVLKNRKALEAYFAAADMHNLPKEATLARDMLKKTPAKADAPLLAILEKGVNPLALKAILHNDGEAGATINTEHLVTQLLNPKNAKIIKQAREDNVAALIKATATTKAEQAIADLTSAHSLGALLTATTSIAGSKAMENETSASSTQRVTTALVDVLVNDRHDTIKTIDPTMFASFFANQTNAKAIRTLLQETQGDIPAAQKGMVAALLKHWDAVQHVSADAKDGAALILDQLKTPLPSNCPTATNQEEQGFMDAIAHKVMASEAVKKASALATDGWLTWKGTSIDGKNAIGTYADELKALHAELAVAQCNITSKAKTTVASR
jgi:hypothetical protein